MKGFVGGSMNGEGGGTARGRNAIGTSLTKGTDKE